MKKDPLYLHFVLHGLEKTVVDSQLIEPALRLGQEGIPVTLLVMEDIVVWLGLLSPIARRKRSARVRGLQLVTLPRVPRNLLYLNMALLFLVSMKSLLSGRRLVVHARGLQGAATWLPLRRRFKSIRILCDVRGIEWDEYAYTKSDGNRIPLGKFQKWWRGHLEMLGRRALQESDLISCVSRSMRQTLIDLTQAKNPFRWIYMPCSTVVDKFDGARKKRAAIRAQRGWTHRLVLIYSGTFRRWQMPEESVRCAAVMKKLDPRFFFYCLTPDVKEFQALVARAGFSSEDCLVEHRPFDQMPEALATGDIGLLLREYTALNRYACPTKFAEYLAAGLAVFTTDAIDDVAAYVRDRYVGTVVRQVNDLSALERDLSSTLKTVATEAVRIQRSVEAARASYDWPAYIPELKKWYLELGTSD